MKESDHTWMYYERTRRFVQNRIRVVHMSRTVQTNGEAERDLHLYVLELMSTTFEVIHLEISALNELVDALFMLNATVLTKRI